MGKVVPHAHRARKLVRSNSGLRAAGRRQHSHAAGATPANDEGRGSSRPSRSQSRASHPARPPGTMVSGTCCRTGRPGRPWTAATRRPGRPSGRHPRVATTFGSSPALLPAARTPVGRAPARSCRRAGNSARFHRAGSRLAGQLLARGAVLQVGGQIGVAVDGGHGRPGLLVAAVHGRPGLPVRQQVPDTMVPGGRAARSAASPVPRYSRATRPSTFLDRVS